MCPISTIEEVERGEKGDDVKPQVPAKWNSTSRDGRLCGKESEESLIYFIVTKCTFQTMIRDRLKIRPRFVHLERVPNAGSVRSICVPSTAIRPSCPWKRACWKPPSQTDVLNGAKSCTPRPRSDMDPTCSIIPQKNLRSDRACGSKIDAEILEIPSGSLHWWPGTSSGQREDSRLKQTRNDHGPLRASAIGHC